MQQQHSTVIVEQLLLMENIDNAYARTLFKPWNLECIWHQTLVLLLVIFATLKRYLAWIAFPLIYFIIYFFIYYLFFDLVNYWISDTFLFKWEKRVYDVSRLQAVKLKDFFCKNYLIFLFLFSVDVLSMSYTFFLIHYLNLKCILHPKAAFSAVCLNTYERFSPQQLLKSRSIFFKNNRR